VFGLQLQQHCVTHGLAFSRGRSPRHTQGLWPYGHAAIFSPSFQSAV